MQIFIWQLLTVSILKAVSFVSLSLPLCACIACSRFCWVFGDKVAKGTQNWQQNKCNRINGNNARMMEKKMDAQENNCQSVCMQGETTNETNVNNNFAANQIVGKWRAGIKTGWIANRRNQREKWTLLDFYRDKSKEKNTHNGNWTATITKTTTESCHSQSHVREALKKKLEQRTRNTSAWEKERHH